MSDLKNTTAIATAFRDIAKAIKAHDSRMASLVAPLVQVGVDPAKDLKPEGAWFDDFKRGVAEAYFTEKQVDAIFDTSLTGKAQVGSKVKRDLVTALSSHVSKVRTAIISEMGATGGGAGGTKATLLESMTGRIRKDHDTLSDVINGTSKLAFWKNFEGDVGPARKALADALKALEALK